MSMFRKTIADSKEEAIARQFQAPPPPAEAYKPVSLEEDGTPRGAMIAAARAYDEVQRELFMLQDQLRSAVAGLEAKNSEIAELRKLVEYQRIELSDLLTQERANVAIANEARDRAYTERADALAWLSSIETIVDRAREGGALQPFRRRRNGKHTPIESPTNAVSDVTVEIGPMPVEGRGEA